MWWNWEWACLAGLFAWAILYDNSAMVKYYTKFFVFMLLTYLVVSIFLPFMFLRPMDPRNGLPAAYSSYWIARLIGINWSIVGKEHIIQNSGAVVVLNHQSSLDILVLGVIWPHFKNGAVIAKRELFYIFPFGLASWLWGTVYINRMSGKHAQESINKASSTITSKKQTKICMFPEGTRSRDADLRPFKKGAFHIAIASQCPIQPIVVSPFYWLDHNTYKFDSGVGTINILPPISTEGLKKEDMDDLMDKTYKIMNDEFHRLSQPNQSTSQQSNLQ